MLHSLGLHSSVPAAGAGSGSEEEQAQKLWEDQVQQPWPWSTRLSSDPHAAHHEFVSTARQAGREVRDPINTAATSLWAVVGADKSKPEFDVHLGLALFPGLKQLAVESPHSAVSWGEAPQSNTQFTPLRLHLDDLQPSLQQVFIAGMYNDWFSHVEITSFPHTPVPGLASLDLRGVSLPQGVPLDLFPGLQKLVLWNCKGWEEDDHPLELKHVPHLTFLKVVEVDGVKTLDIAPVPHLQHLTWSPATSESGHSLRQLNLALPGGEPRTALQCLDISNNHELEGIDLSPVPNLQHFVCNRTAIGMFGDGLDLGPCSQLATLDIRAMAKANLDHPSHTC